MEAYLRIRSICCRASPATYKDKLGFVHFLPDETLCSYISQHKDYEEDFIQNRPSNQSSYVQLVQRWRDKYEKLVDSRPRVQPLDTLSHYLTDFQYGKFDEIEVPGQYTEVGFLGDI